MTVDGKQIATEFKIGKIFFYLIVVAIAIFFLAPILWQVLTSLKLNKDISAVPNVYLPTQITFKHYAELFTRKPFIFYILNSALVSLISTFLCLTLGSPAAYVLARLKLPGKNLI
jgi:multiple sugar transport system permease protein